MTLTSGATGLLMTRVSARWSATGGSVVMPAESQTGLLAASGPDGSGTVNGRRCSHGLGQAAWLKCAAPHVSSTSSRWGPTAVSKIAGESMRACQIGTMRFQSAPVPLNCSTRPKKPQASYVSSKSGANQIPCQRR